MTGILGAAADYWIVLGLSMGRNVVRHMSDDFGSYVSLSCDGEYVCCVSLSQTRHDFIKLDITEWKIVPGNKVLYICR